MDRTFSMVKAPLLLVLAGAIAGVSPAHAAPRTDPFTRVTKPARPEIRKAVTQEAAPARERFLVILDPGHGGSDDGTVYDNGKVRIAEKDITLRLGFLAARELRTRGYEVVLTRENDRDLPLPDRTAMANRLKADVFISLHMNSTATPMVPSSPQGVETYILNSTSDASSRRLAELENSVVNLEHAETPEEKDIALILKDLTLDANLVESKRLACAVQTQLVRATLSRNESPSLASTRNRGVKQALFHVLLGANMPSILVEAGFITHPRDRQIVLSRTGQRSLAEALADAIDRYRGVGNPGKSPAKSLAQLGSCKVN